MEMDFPTLAGPRISLRRVEADSPADVEAMHRCYQCPEVHRYTQGRAFRLEEWPEVIRGWEMERQKGGFIRWGNALTGDGALIGDSCSKAKKRQNMDKRSKSSVTLSLPVR